MLFKCKICGGELNIQKGQSIVECEYCGVKQTLPRFLDENTKLMYDRANSYLLHNEFDKAENIYNQILLADKEDAEAYWNLVLCKYGVTYVKDPASGKYIPTCNRTHYASVFNDENYQNAIKYANAEKAELYEQDAKTIDDIQRGILSISKHEKPFDIFISYKETGENGARTKDSIKAQELYDKLTAEGYKVFFSRITLEDKIGTEYEPYIYAALASSKIMLVIGSSKENLEAVWVKNEWSRYLSFTQRDSEKTLIPLYFDMDKADLPDEFAHLTAYDMTVDGFEQELIRGIKKLIPLPVMLAERRKKFRRKLKIAGVAVLVLAVIGGIASVPWFMKLPDYNAAMQLYYDKNYPEAAWAFADLGSYRDSAEMKDKCERSWRNSLANTVVWDNSHGDDIYCITPNGTIKNLKPTGISKTDGIKETLRANSINIFDEFSLVALYENGTIALGGTPRNEQLFLDVEEWADIVKVTDVKGHIYNAEIALQNDGKLKVTNKTDSKYIDSWLTELSKWDRIVDFEAICDEYKGRMTYFYIIGINQDGTLCSIMMDSSNLNNTDEKSYFDISADVIKQFSNVKSISVDRNILAALTKNETVQVYVNNTFHEYQAPDTVEIEITKDYIYELKKDGNLYALPIENIDDNEKNRLILSDVVNISKESLGGIIAISRTGGIYKWSKEVYPLNAPYSITQVDETYKSVVYNEWLERMN